MKRVACFMAALLLSGGAGLAMNLTLQSGPQDPSQLLGTVNTLIQTLNNNAAGALAANLSVAGTAATTENILQTYTMPANTLQAGQSVRARCWGKTEANTNGKSARLYFGTSASNIIATPTMQVSGQTWELVLSALKTGSNTQVVFGQAIPNLSTVTTIANATSTETDTSGIVIRCTGLTPTATGDLTAQGMIVEIIR